MQKTADHSNSHTSENNSVTEYCTIVPTSKQVNALVTELLPKSALFCLLRIETYCAN